MPCLFRVHSGPYKGKVFPVEATRPLLVGRALEADFTIPDGAIHSFHCKVEFDRGESGRMARVRLVHGRDDEPLEVDGVPLDEAMLKSGDKVRIGDTTLEFREGGSADDPVGGAPAELGRACAGCRRTITSALGGGRMLLGLPYCAHCVDLRLIVKRELGRYRVFRKIGRDVAGIAYLAEDLRSEPPDRIALHVLKSERQRDPRVLRRFLVKAAAGFAVDSPVFALTRDLVHKPEVVSYAEELCEWPSLAERMQTGRTLPMFAAAKAIFQLCEGLRYARRRGMIVGKIRAVKLHVSDKGQVRIRDYWVAPALEEALAAQVGAPEAPPLADVVAALASVDPVAVAAVAAIQAELSGSAEDDDGETTESGAPVEDVGMSGEMRRYLGPEARDVAHYKDEALDIRPLGAVFLQLATGNIEGEPTPAEILDRARRAYLETRRPAAPAEPPPLLKKLLVRTLDRVPANRYRFLAELSKDAKALAAIV